MNYLQSIQTVWVIISVRNILVREGISILSGRLTYNFQDFANLRCHDSVKYYHCRMCWKFLYNPKNVLHGRKYWMYHWWRMNDLSVISVYLGLFKQYKNTNILRHPLTTQLQNIFRRYTSPKSIHHRQYGYGLCNYHPQLSCI